MKLKEVAEAVNVLEEKVSILKYLMEKLDIGSDTEDESAYIKLENGDFVSPESRDEIWSLLKAKEKEYKLDIDSLNNTEVSIVKRKLGKRDQ